MSSSALSDDDWNRPRPFGGLGPAALLLPILSALFIGLWITDRQSDKVPAAQQARADREVELRVWDGVVALSDGRSLHIRLSPLQAEAHRQAFDREALAHRFALGTGEAWRVEVGCAGAASAGAASASTLQAITWQEVRVLDRDGEASLELVHQGVSSSDPLLVLFSPSPTGVLESGQTVQFVMWGRAPLGASRLQGLALGGAAFDVALRELELHEAELPTSVAHRTAVEGVR